MRCASEEETTKIFLHRTGGEDAGAARTLRRSTERRPLRMHSLSPVPSTTTSYSTSMAAIGGVDRIVRWAESDRWRERGSSPERSRKMWISNGSSGGYWGRSGRKGDEAVVRASSLTRSHPGGRSYLPSGPPRPTQNRAAHEFVHAKPNQQQQQGAFIS